MTWTVLFHDAFNAEFEALVEELQDELLAHAKLLATFGPVTVADARYDDHLGTLSQSTKESKNGKKTR